MIGYLKRLWARASARPKVAYQISGDVLGKQSADALFQQINRAARQIFPKECVIPAGTVWRSAAGTEIRWLLNVRSMDLLTPDSALVNGKHPKTGDVFPVSEFFAGPCLSCDPAALRVDVDVIPPHDSGCPICGCPGRIGTAELFQQINDGLKRGHKIHNLDWTAPHE